MTDSLVQGLTSALGGKVSSEIIIFIISMIPILELRGGLLAASPALLNVPILRAIPICIAGNLLPIPFILLLIEKVLELSWVESTDTRISESECNLSDIVQDVHENLLSQAMEKNISFTLDSIQMTH